MISQLIQRLGNPRWDLLIVGDGSGSGWDKACGWAATLIDNTRHARRFFYGAMDCGSVNFAESMPYIQALTWYDQHHGKETLRELGFLNVHILTDSQVIATWGTQAMQLESELPRKQLAIWSAMRELRRVGYHCTFHWAPRLTTGLNWAADIMAGISRVEIERAGDPTYINGNTHAIRAANAIGNLVFHDPLTGLRLDPYTINPSNHTGT